MVLRGDRSEEKIAFDWLPDHPGNFVFRISTPVLAGEALKINNEQSFALKVIRDRVRVLHLSGRPSWDERFLRVDAAPRSRTSTWCRSSSCAPRATSSPGTATICR